MTTARLVRHQFRYDLRSFLRDRQARVATLALPVVFLVLFAGVLGDFPVREHGAELGSDTLYVPGVVSLGIVSAPFATLVVAVTVQREFGVLKRRRATPVPAWVLIAGRVLTSIAVALVLAAVLIALARFAFGVAVRAEALPAVALTVVLGSATLSCLGYALTTVIATADAAQPIVQAVLLLAGGFEYEAGDAAAERLLGEGLPDAVLAVNDEVAIGLVTGLRSRGIDVPGRVSVAGIDDTRPARLVALTSVSRPLHEMGTRAASVVVHGTGGDAVLAHRLVPRKTMPREP